MEEVLQHLNAVQGVIGSFVCDDSGELLAYSFPPLFDVSIIRRAAAQVVAQQGGLRTAAGTAELADLRYADGRILVKPLQEAFLLLLCTKSVNLQVLNISLNVAKGKIEALLPSTQPAAAAVPASGGTVPSGGLSLPACHLEDSTIGSSFEQFGMAALTQTTAHQISNHFASGPLKKLKLTHQTTGVSGVFPVMVVNENDASYDGKIILCKAIEKKLKTGSGDLLTVEIP
ncbi:hypothetical protein GURASL_30790 [Geotalea uraniireducens]|uniref:Roadblock/LAMTOR2 domain-containing protein n=1 Tax=Geotalea uraniireducens TaxID=351604 RepID=A0ABN6VY76_9BACT|nr:roadblock/LC7 domain-containing protein [Geotalea uraniireducens]BDV44156.1 hypothetical protein GURASL_30790 [Geotalea uraniireducens]